MKDTKMKTKTNFDTTFCATKECSKCTNEFCNYSEEDYGADYEKYDRNSTETYIDLNWLEEMEHWNS